MAILSPILQTPSAFDATLPYTFKFIVLSGSDQTVKNKIVIRKNSDNSVVYTNTVTTFNFEQTIPLNTLTNGVQYNAQISVFNINNVESTLSNTVLFTCYSTPTLTLDVNSGIVNSSHFDFPGNYLQSEGELIDSFQYYLYNQNNELIASSPVQYLIPLEYTFYGLKESQEYGVELKIVTVHGMEVSTGIIPFSVKYLTPSLPTAIRLENLSDKGYIKVSGEFISITGKCSSETPLYIDNELIDLTNGDKVDYDEGFSISGDFTKKIFFKNPMNRKTLITFTNSNNLNQTLKLVYFDNKIELFQQNCNLTYYTYSNTITTPLSTDLLLIWFQRKNGLIDIKLTNLG